LTSMADGKPKEALRSSLKTMTSTSTFRGRLETLDVISSH
jgi:hypothetical protein